MLTLDIGRLSQAQLGDAVSGHCAQFGTVKYVKIMPPAAHRDYAIAAVEMSDAVGADRLRVKTGDSKIGLVVIIKLIAAKLYRRSLLTQAMNRRKRKAAMGR